VTGAVSRYLRIATNRKVLLFAPTGWRSTRSSACGPYRRRYCSRATSRYEPVPDARRLRHLHRLRRGDLAVVFGSGLLFWGLVYSRFRRTTMLLLGVGAFVVMTLDVLAINHLGGTSTTLLVALVGIGVGRALRDVRCHACRARTAADVSEGFEEDRSAIMGLYSVFLGLGQVIGAVIGGVAASWKGIDGLIVATAGLLVIGIVTLLNLRAHEGALIAGAGGQGPPVSIRESIRDTLSPGAGARPRPPGSAVKEER
jgi:hypothetical protein